MICEDCEQEFECYEGEFDGDDFKCYQCLEN